MINKDSKVSFKLWEVIVITIVASLIMSLSTGFVTYKKFNNEKNVNNSKQINDFIKTYNNILNNYYDKIDENELIDAAINGMLNYLGDPYTTYLNESNTNLLTDSLKGTYEGVGVEITNNTDHNIVITKVFDNSPASNAGIKVGDVIIKIDGSSLKDKDSSEAVNLIKSNNTDSIAMEVDRDGKTLSFNLSKASLYVPAVYTQIFNQNSHKVGYIQIGKFSDTSYDQFKTELKKLEDSYIDRLIIDVRNNTGGYLTEATSIIELFLEKGKVIYSLENRLSKDEAKDSTDEHRTYPIYVLINQGSASASEVLAGALKYSYNATLLGTTTFGKGKVQKTSTLNDGTMYKYTSAKWLMPNGKCIDEVGIVPDIVVETSEEYINKPTFDNDNVIHTAIYEIAK